MLEPVHRLCAARIAEASALALIVGACSALTDLDYLGRGGEDAASSGTGAGGVSQGGAGSSGALAAGGEGGCDMQDCGETGGAGGSGAHPGDAGGAGGVGGMPDTSDCLGCAMQQCTSRGLDCYNNDTCMTWMACVEACTDADCAYACDDMYSSAHTLYEHVYVCVCMYCLDACAALEPCAHGN